MKRVYKLEEGGRRLVGQPKKTWRNVAEREMRKLNIMESTAD